MSETCRSGRRFSPGIPVSSINKADRHDITKQLLNVACNTITLTLICLLFLCYSFPDIWLYALDMKKKTMMKKIIFLFIILLSFHGNIYSFPYSPTFIFFNGHSIFQNICVTKEQRCVLIIESNTRCFPN